MQSVNGHELIDILKKSEEGKIEVAKWCQRCGMMLVDTSFEHLTLKKESYRTPGNPITFWGGPSPCRPVPSPLLLEAVQEYSELTERLTEATMALVRASEKAERVAARREFDSLTGRVEAAGQKVRIAYKITKESI